VTEFAKLIIDKFQWARVAVVYEAADSYSNQCKNAFETAWLARHPQGNAVAEQQIAMHNFGEDTTDLSASAVSIVDKLKSSEFRVIVSFLSNIAYNELFLSKAALAGILGTGTTARGWAFLSIVSVAAGFGVKSDSLGILNLSAHYDDGKDSTSDEYEPLYEELSQVWQNEARYLKLEHEKPLKNFFDLELRNELASTCQFPIGSIYDAVSAMVLAQDARIRDAKVKIQNGGGTVNSLYDFLMQGVSFTGTTGPVVRWPYPQADYKVGQTWQERSGAVKYQLNYASADLTMQKLGERVTSVENFDTTLFSRITWPGTTNAMPMGEASGPCKQLNIHCTYLFFCDCFHPSFFLEKHGMHATTLDVYLRIELYGH